MSLSQQMYWVCSDVLSLILQLRSSRDLPAPDILQRRVLGLFDTMMQNGKEARIPEQDMIDAVTAALNRDRLRRASENQAVAVVDRYTTLSPREREVMALVTAGKMNKQVAAELGLSEVTVKIHRGTAMRKMGAHSLADLVRMADVLKNQSTFRGLRTLGAATLNAARTAAMAIATQGTTGSLRHSTATISAIFES